MHQFSFQVSYMKKTFETSASVIWSGCLHEKFYFLANYRIDDEICYHIIIDWEHELANILLYLVSFDTNSSHHYALCS